MNLVLVEEQEKEEEEKEKLFKRGNVNSSDSDKCINNKDLLHPRR